VDSEVQGDKKMSGICEKCGSKTYFNWEKLCYTCSKEKARDEIISAIKEGDEDVDTGSSDYVICPYCGEYLETCYGYEDFPELYEEGEHKIDCPECEKTFKMESSCSWYYETSKIEEDE